jgi:hypothetical protein
MNSLLDQVVGRATEIDCQLLQFLYEILIQGGSEFILAYRSRILFFLLNCKENPCIPQAGLENVDSGMSKVRSPHGNSEDKRSGTPQRL